MGGRNANILGSHLTRCSEFFGLGVEAVKKPVGPRLDAPVPLAVLPERTVYD